MSEEKPAEPIAQSEAQSQPTAAPPAAYPGQPGAPPSYTAQNQPLAAPGQPTATGVAGYPPGHIPGQPTAGAPGYPPGYVPGQPGYPQGGYNPGLVGAAMAQQGLAANMAPAQVNWMPMPENIAPGCPPGLEYLTQIDQLLVHQQIELLELVTNYETENKYRIRNTLGQQVYFAKEQSSVLQRQCCGPGREFSMAITDNSGKEVIHLERPLRCYYNCSGLTCYCCLSCCLPHIIEVQSPPGTVVGYVKQDFSGIFRPWFSIQNAEGDTVLKIKGPTLGCACYADANFQVLSADTTQEVGKITKQWGGLAKEYFTDADNFGIQFPMDLDVKMKAVMVGAVFLIDFMFFETPGGQGGNRHHR